MTATYHTKKLGLSYILAGVPAEKAGLSCRYSLFFVKNKKELKQSVYPELACPAGAAEGLCLISIKNELYMMYGK